MSEITDDYRGDPNVHRYGPVNAKAAKLSGTGSLTSYAWVITEDVLPDELIDSDESTSEASGAPTLRISLDESGVNQIPVQIMDFTPASGGSGGGATAEIWLNPTTYTGGAALPIYIWWITGGSQTQPAEDADNGVQQVYTGISLAYIETDASDSTSNENDGTFTGTGSGTSTDVPFGSAESIDFSGSEPRIVVPDDATLDADTKVTVLLWFKADSDTGTFQGLVTKRTTGTSANYSLAFNVGSNMDWNYYSSGFKGNSASWATHFSTGTWYHVIGEMYEDGSDVEVALYKNAVSIDSDTISSSSLPTNSDTLKIGNIEQVAGVFTSFEFDGKIKALWIIKETLDAGQKTTIYNNQSDPADFWDNASASVADGPFEDSALYTFEHSARNRTWTGNIYRKGYVGSTTTICTGRELVITWGRQQNTFDSRVRAAEMFFDVVDADLSVYNALISDDYVESDWYIELVDSTSTYTIRMRVRLDETDTSLVGSLRTQITRVYCYCGMAELVNIDAITATSATFSEMFSTILASHGIAQDITVLSQHYPKNISSTGVLYDLMRLNRLDLIFAENGRKRHNMYDQLKGLLEGFGMVAMNGMDGRWSVKHEYALGETQAGIRGAMRYLSSSGAFTTLNTLENTNYSLLDARVSASAMKRPVRPIQAVEVTRGNSNSKKYATVDLVRFGDFEEGWESSSSHVSWQGTNIERSTLSDTGTYAVSFANNTDLFQNFVRLSGLQNLDFEVTMRLAMRENTNASGSTKQIQIFLRLWNIANDGVSPVGWGGVDGWSESLTAIVYSTQSVGNASTLIYNTVITTFRGPLLDEDGYLQLYLFNTNTDKTVFIDTCEVRVKQGDDPEAQFIGVAARYGIEDISPFNTFRIGDGDVVEQRVHWWNGILGTDDDGDGARNNVYEMMQVLTTPSGTWAPMGDWKSEVVGFTALEYGDLFDLTGSIRISQQDTKLNEIEGEALEIIPPDHTIEYDGLKHIQVFTEIDLTLETTKFIAREKKIGATSSRAIFFVGNDDDMFYHMDENFENETNTGLDLSLYSIIDIERHAVTGKIYGLSSNGQVHSWNEDGTGFTTLFSSGFNDFERILVDHSNSHLLLSAHQAALFNNRTYYYGLTGGSVKDYENRFSSASLREAFYATGDYFYIYNVLTMYRIDTNTGVASDLQTLAAATGGGATYVPAHGAIYGIGGSGLYSFSSVTNVGSPTLITAGLSSGNSDFMDHFEVAGQTHIVGCTAGLIWSVNLGSSTYTAGRSTNNAKAICTRR